LITVSSPETVIAHNRFLGIRVVTGITLGDGSNVLESNIFDDCVSEGYLISAIAAAGDPNRRTITSNYIRNHQGQIFTGNNVLMSDNFVNVTDIVGGGTSIVTMTADDSNIQSVLSNNVWVFDTAAGSNTTTVDFKDGLIDGNFITTGSIEADPQGTSPRDLIFNNNNVLMENGSLEILGTQNGTVVVSGNDIKVDGNFIALNINDTASGSATKVVSVTDNAITSTGTTTTTARIGTSGLSSTTRWLINSNVIENGSSRGMEVFASNINITDNITLGATGTDIFLDSTVQNAYVTDNQAGNAAITHGSSTPINVYIGPNKGVESKVTFSVWNGFIDGYAEGWEASSDTLVADGTTLPLYFPLNLPVGVEIVTADILISANVAASVAVEFFTRTAGATLLNLGTASTLAGHGINFLTLTPTSTTYVRTNQEYFLKIVSNTLGDRVHQVVATIKY
jgi:hypothetical protein